MMMKKHLFSSFAVTMLMAFAVSFTLTSCSEEILEDKQGTQQEEIFDIPEGAVVFSTTADATRTSIDPDGKFYWTENNKIWVDTGEDDTFATGSDNMKMSDDKRFARFFFTNFPDGLKDEYNLTYTGTNPISATKVEIKADQSQTDPNDGTIVGINGDCATAVATRNEKGQYIFTLHHEAHYLILQPYKDIAIPDARDWKLKKIEIISLDNEPLSGTYNFGKNGLVASSVTGASNTVIINTGGADGKQLIKWDKEGSDPNPNPIWYAVIAPATDGAHRLRIKYTVDPDAYINYDGNASTLVKEEIVITKDVTINSAANKVTKITHKMTVLRVPTDEFYQWNAIKSYWWHENDDPTSNSYYYRRPTWYTDANTDDYPQYTTDIRFTTLTSKAPSNTSTPASNNPCDKLPNVNAMTWYAMAGDARWDNEYPWRFDDDFEYIYTQGTWFKKWDVIVSENSVLDGKTKTDCDVSFMGTIDVYNNDGSVKDKDRVYDGSDYRSKQFPPFGSESQANSSWFQPRFPSYKTAGRPNDISDYFFLPASGHFNNGKLESIGVIHGCYWSSTAVPGREGAGGVGCAYIMETKDFSLWVRQGNGNAGQGRYADVNMWQ